MSVAAIYGLVETYSNTTASVEGLLESFEIEEEEIQNDRMVGEINEAVERGPAKSSLEDLDADENTAALLRDRLCQRKKITEALVLAGATRNWAPRRSFTDEARYREL